MTNRKTTKRALLMSVLSMFLCFTMLVGTTFAWFTDEVKSGVNQIVAGSLDVEVYTAEGDSIQDYQKLFDDVKLWEPGVVAYENVTVVNEGTLALKYELSVNFANENTVDGYGLSDVLQVAVVPEKITETDRDKLVASIDNWQLLSEWIENGTLYPEDYVAPADAPAGATYPQEITYGIVIWWEPSEEDNNWNVNNKKITSDGEDHLHIDLGVKLYATQLEAEMDSFGDDYDEDAIYTNVVVTSEAELKEALANAKNGDVIGIEGNVTWTTGAGIGSTPFVEAATTYSLKPAVQDLTLIGIGEGATFTAIGSGVGAIGIDNGTVTFKNLKIVDESVSYVETAWEYGYLEFRGNTVFKNCEIVNAVMMEGDSAIFENCTFNSNKDSEYAVWISDGDATFENCYITGARGIKIHEAYGSEVDTVIIKNNQFADLTKKPGLAIGTLNAKTTVVLTNNTFAGTQAGDQGLYSYETDTDVTTFDFVCADNTVAGYADTNAELKDQLTNNATVVLPKGEYTLPSMNGKEGITIIGEADGSTVIGGESTSTGFGSNFGKDTTIQNVTFSGTTNGVRYSYANGGISTFDNCTFAGDSVYGFHIDASNGATFIFNNCTFSGFNAFASDLEKVVFNNCTFLNNGNYGHTNIWSIGEFNNCTFGDGASVGTRGDNAHIYFNDVEESYHHEFIGSAESLFAFAESVNEGGDSWKGQKVLLVADIDLENKAWTPIGQTGATEFKGIFDGQNYTIKNLYVDNTAYTDEHTSTGLFGWAESGVTIQNVKVDGATMKGNHNVAVIVGYTYSSKIINCHVSNATVVCKHANGDACGDKSGLIVGYAGDESRITDCSGSDSTVTGGRDAGQLIGAGYNVSVSGCTATNVTVTAGGDCNREGNVNNAIIGRVLG